jgi:hypothetical protein
VFLTSTGWQICNSVSIQTPLGLSSIYQFGWVISSCSHSCPPEISTVMQLQQHVGAEEGALWQQVASNFAITDLLSWVKGSFTRVNVQHGTPGFTSLLNELVLWIFITLKNPLTSDVNLGSFGEHVTTKPPMQTRWKNIKCFLSTSLIRVVAHLVIGHMG